MRDHELYATILGLTAPWTVERVDADFLGGAVHVWLARTDGAPAQCPECQTTCPIYDHREREWRHLDTCQLQTRLHARVPRVECPTHGVLQSPIPWATPGSKFTLLFERLAIDWLREAAVPAVARQLGLGWDAVWGIERRAVARGLERRGTLMLRYVGVDEKSFQRRYDFVTVVSDLERARVLFVADDRKRESLEALWALGLTDAQRSALEAIAMDMWVPYVQATRAQVPGADQKIASTAFTVRSISTRASIACAGPSSVTSAPRATRGSTAQSTRGCGIPIGSVRRRGGRSVRYATARSRWRGPGRSRRRRTCGSTATSVPPAPSSAAGTSGRRTRA